MKQLQSITLLFCLILFPRFYAQQIGKLVEASHDIYLPFTIRTLGTDDGIPQNQIAVLTADESNNLVIGTANGYTLFNGQYFRPIANNDKAKWILPAFIHYDKQSKQITCLDNRSNEYIISPTVRLLSGNLFSKITFFEDSVYGVTKDGMVYSALIGTGKYNPLVQAPHSEDYRFIGKLGSHLLISSEKGSFLRTNDSWKKISNEFVTCTKQNPNKNETYALTDRNVFIYSNEHLKTLDLQIPPGDYYFTDIAFTPNNEVFISSKAGLYYHNQYYSELFDLNSGLPSQVLLSMYYNQEEDMLFIGTGDRGLMQLKVKECISIYNPVNLGQASLGSIIKTDQDEILVFGSSGYIYKFNWNSFESYFSSNSLGFSSLAFINHKVWAGTWGQGIFLLSNRKIVDSIPANQLAGGTVHSIFEDSQKRIWIGTGSGISMIRNNTILKNFRRELNIGIVICFYECKNGDILVGGEKGVFCFDRNLKFRYHIGYKDGLIAKEVRSFHEIGQDTLLIGTYGGGVYYYHQKKLRSINALNNCLLDVDAFTLVPDDQGYLYMTSNHGLYIVKMKHLIEFAENKRPYLLPFKIGENDGILNSEFNGGFQNNYYKNSAGHFYFPSIQGLVISYFSVPKFRKLNPQLDEIYINDRKHILSEHVFERSTHTISFKFHCTNFSSFYNIHYQYKLIGADFNQDWSTLHTEGTVSFKMLPPGDYTVYIRGVDGFNDPHPKIVTYRFRIKRLFYEKASFKIGLAGLLFLGIFLFIYRRVQSLKKKELYESDMRNTMNEIKLAALQSKMNPHFIFNCLNNIQNLIVLGKSEEAQNAMTDFSSLLRKFLQQSENTFIPLREEIALLQSYLRVEKFRFEEDLSVEFDIPSNLGMYYIPTLLIQPTVENALLHGLSHKQGNKKLLIRAFIQSNHLHILIDDNGIGRKNSRKINSQRKDHVSHGSKIISDKIDLLRERYGYSIKFEIIDKANDQGTIVKFILPVITDIEPKN